ncbi:MAG: prephenate dehydratase, partial [Syntrophobacteraceae bacterium]
LYVIAPVVGKQLDYAYLDKAAIMKPRRDSGKAPSGVVYSGVPGSFSHKASLQFFGTEVPIRNCASFRKVFDLVDSEEAAFGVIPVENSLTGSIHENYDLLLEFDLRIVGELTLRIKHNLLGNENSTIEGLERIYSHPQVFQQCREYLEKNPDWDLIACSDTASAVKRVKEGGDLKEGAIAGAEADDVYQMTLLKEGIETNPRNFTRFVVISKSGFLPGLKNKSSLIFSVSDKPGALFETLRILAENNINLVKLESRPIHSRPWEYLFYADLEVDVTDEAQRHILESLNSRTEFLKLLGSYQKGTEASR